jgi:D-arginine dehydrogenase
MNDVTEADVVVVGAGLAGAASAYFLARQGRRVTVLERERHPGAHASGRNAAMVRQTAMTPGLTASLAEGARFLRRPPPDIGAVHVRSCGSLLLLDAERAERMRLAVPDLVAHRVPVAWTTPSEVECLAPLTRGATFARALYTFDDGVVDVSALLHGYLRAAMAAGGRVRTGETLRAIHVADGRVRSVETDTLHIRTPTVVNAAGAWSGAIAGLAGGLDIPLRPTRRHLMQTGPTSAVDRQAPIVWDEGHGIYFRPESAGLLLSACDETDHAPGEPAVDPGAVDHLADKLTRWLPQLAAVSLRRVWAGLRTLTPDGRFVIGPDPCVSGFFWCAGLGGHGVTASAAVGRMTAEAVAGDPVPATHSVARFARAMSS